MISAVLPCFNAGPYLAQALRSIFSQTRPADEVIVVDDCSTDGSAAIAREHGVVVLGTATNSGHATARNLGIARARGDLIAWLDADDYWEPNHLEVVCGLLDRFPEAAVAFSRVRLFGTREEIWGNTRCDLPRRVFQESFRHTVVPAMSAVTRKAALQRVGGYSESIRYAPDFDLWLRMSRQFPFVSTRLVTANYRWHDSQISTASPDRQWLSVYRSRVAMIDRLRTDGEPDAARELESVLARCWEHDLTRSLRTRRFADLRFYASLSPLLPRKTAAARLLCRLAALTDSLVGAEDRLPAPVRRLLRHPLTRLRRNESWTGNAA